MDEEAEIRYRRYKEVKNRFKFISKVELYKRNTQKHLDIKDKVSEHIRNLSLERQWDENTKINNLKCFGKKICKTRINQSSKDYRVVFRNLTKIQCHRHESYEESPWYWVRSPTQSLWRQKYLGCLDDFIK